MSATKRPPGLRLIIAYKLVKAPLMLALALLLAAAPGHALRLAGVLVRDLSDAGATPALLGAWIKRHLSHRYLVDAAALAGIDALLTALEAFLLWQGKAWGEWIVIVVLAGFLPIEAASLVRHRGALRLAALLLNAACVGYLVRLRLRDRIKKDSSFTADRQP